MGDVREIIGIISDELYDDVLAHIPCDPKSLYNALLKSGLRRAKRR